MNAKTCKKLRKLAYGLSVGMPVTSYQRSRLGVVTLDLDCTRAVYKKLKRAHADAR